MQKGWHILSHTHLSFLSMALLAKRERQGMNLHLVACPMCDICPCMLSNVSDYVVRYDTVFTFLLQTNITHN